MNDKSLFQKKKVNHQKRRAFYSNEKEVNPFKVTEKDLKIRSWRRKGQ